MANSLLFEPIATGFPPPRPFQDSAHEALREGVRAGHRCQMLMSPTGSGKTYLGLRIIHEAVARGKRAVFMCDRNTLIQQTSDTADRYGLVEHGIVQASHWRHNPQLPFQICSAQTVARRKWPEADVIVIDEAHTQMKAWTEHIPTCDATVIGLSATPFSAGLGKLFSRVVNAATMNDLTHSGVLVPLRILSCTPTDMRGAKTAGGEWTDSAAEERGLQIVGDVVSEWVKYGEHRKTIVFGSTIKHCEELCAQFNAIGVMAATFTSNTTDTERQLLLKEYRKPNSVLRVLISVEALAKGFDVPDVSCVVDCRPLRKSLSTAIQMWGRGMRSSPGKTDCLLLDHTGNIVRFARDFEDIYFAGLDALDDGEKLDRTIRTEDDDEELKGCPSCGHKPFMRRCMACGYEYKAPALVESTPGQMQEITLGGKKLADDKRHLWAQLCHYARIHSAPEKRQGRAAHLFREMTGVWPPFSWKIETTSIADITPPVLNHIRRANIAYAKRQAA